MRKNASSGDSDNSILIMVGAIFCIVLLLLVYAKYKAHIHAGLGELVRLQVLPFAPFLSVPARIAAWAERARFETYSLADMMTLMGIAGRYFRWLTIPVCLFLFVKIFTGSVVERYRFKMSAQELIQHNARFLPCLRPIANWEILKENIDSGPWRVAQQALQFAVANKLLLIPGEEPGMRVPVDADRVPGKRGLVLTKSGIPRENSPCLIRVDGTFDRAYALTFEAEAALTVFEQQMGDRYQGKESLPPHVLGLAAAFMAFGLGDKTEAQRLLDHMSTTFSWHQEHATWDIDIANAGELFDTFIEREEITDLIKQHGAYITTLLMSLLGFAKHKGVLACSQYVWLRPADRGLWYALNQVGGKAAWPEAAGPWAHYQFEDRLGEAVEEPQCKEAVTALRYVLEMEGWLPSPGAASSGKQGVSGIAQKPKSAADPRTAFQKGQ